jgi:hypothetical protein
MLLFVQEGIEVGNGLPTLATAKEVNHVTCPTSFILYQEGHDTNTCIYILAHVMQVIAAVEKAGFEVIEFYDANQGVHRCV